MKYLETKIHPPIVMAISALLMWFVSKVTPTCEMDSSTRLILVSSFVLVGFTFAASGLIAFRKQRTTIDPAKPEASSSLVTSGVYRLTRNPMYVGLLFVLLAWAVYLCSPITLFGAFGFAVYINQFQIKPEERVLQKLFGSEYEVYKSSVSKWL